MAAAVAAVGTLLLGASLSAASPWVARAAAPEAHPVLAYYYAWWGPGDFDRTVYRPDLAYDSDDGAVIERHIEQAQSAGIDGFVTSWYGNGDRTDANLARLLDLGQQRGFRATIHFETPRFWGVEDTIAQLQAFYANRLEHPAMVRYAGQPVIFFWRAAKYDNRTWSFIRSQVDPEHRAVWLADGDDFGILRGDAWEGISPYAIAWSVNPATQLPSWAARAQAVAPNKLWVPPVSPGCNDAAARAATCIRERDDGSYYQATWQGALASNPSWAVIVSTFNEWMEATQIEPSVQYGDRYLRITRQNADVFRAAF
ncbi:MAG: hypothetical protein M3336_12560 [Chloroflexota bacterium]|nr:hypothetical protein [Chloroflexota bacterium]